MRPVSRNKPGVRRRGKLVNKDVSEGVDKRGMLFYRRMTDNVICCTTKHIIFTKLLLQWKNLKMLNRL